MLEVLPLHALREEDGPIVGSNLLYLSQLAQAGFPIVQGIVVVPPEFALKTIIEHFQLHSKEIFEQRLEIVRSEIKKIPIPHALTKEAAKRRLDEKKLWHHLLDLWLSEIRSKIWREGLGNGISLSLTAEPVLFTEEIQNHGQAYFNYQTNKVEIRMPQSELAPALHSELESLVKSGNKKLLIPHIYFWIIEKRKLKITKLTPFTQYIEQSIDDTLKAVNSSTPPKKAVPQSSLHIFLHLDQTFRIEEGINGFYITSEKIVDWDRKVFQLFEAAALKSRGGVLYALTETHDQFGGIGGTLKLIHSRESLKKDAEVIKFVRNKKSYHNCNVAIPFCRSVEEYLELKRMLMTHGISRGGSLKYFLQFSVPENLLNCEDYIEVGLDGIIFDLDKLAGWIGGFDPSHHESFYYKKQIKALVLMIEPTLKIMHKLAIPFIAKGELALHDDILSFLVQKGMWGLIVDHANAGSIHERLRLLEQRLFKNNSKVLTYKGL